MTKDRAKNEVVLSVRVLNEQAHRLGEIAKYLGLSISETVRLLIENSRVEEVVVPAISTKIAILRNEADPEMKTTEQILSMGKSLADLARLYGLPYQTFCSRIRRGWDLSVALQAPVVRGQRGKKGTA